MRTGSPDVSGRYARRSPGHPPRDTPKFLDVGVDGAFAIGTHFDPGESPCIRANGRRALRDRSITCAVERLQVLGQAQRR